METIDVPIIRPAHNIYMLSASHGGISLGRQGLEGRTYLTPGKRSPEIPPGIYEGEFNRNVVSEIGAQMHLQEMMYENLVPGPINVPLRNRIAYVNKLEKALRKQKRYQNLQDVNYLAIHANASRSIFGQKWTDAHGFTIFCHPSSTKGKHLAANIENSIIMHLGNDIQTRGIKYSRWFREIWGPKGPAVIIECGFMTNQEEAMYLAMPSMQELIGYAIFEGCLAIENEVRTR